MRTIKNFWPIIALCYTCIACEGVVDIDPPQHQIVKEDVFRQDETAIAAMDGIYHVLYGSTVFASGSRSSVATLGGFASDELEGYSSDIAVMEFNQNEISISNSANFGMWSSAYNILYMSNAILEGIASSEDITDEVRGKLEGEAKFIRGFTYFYLVNLFGDVPLITTTSFSTNAMSTRSSMESLYAQIVQDLQDAQGLLSGNYRSSERTRPNKFAAMALLARVYLYLEDWKAAESIATQILQETATYGLSEDLDTVFLANSREAIWQISPVISSHTNEAALFILEDRPTFAALSQVLVSSFQEVDKRYGSWIGSISDGTDTFHFSRKYKVKDATGTPMEYSMVLRIAEQYLIRAEARARSNKFTLAIADLDVVRGRAGLPLIAEVDPEIGQSALLEAIMIERRRELFMEWGHRWLDLKRSGTAVEVLASLKSNWDTTDQLFPIPEQEIIKNPNLTQNKGY